MALALAPGMALDLDLGLDQALGVAPALGVVVVSALLWWVVLCDLRRW